MARLVVGFFLLLFLESCGTGGIHPLTVGSLTAGDERYLQLARKCYPEVSRFTRLRQGAIFISDRIETSQGPMLLMEAAGTKLYCKKDKGGGVHVFRNLGERSDTPLLAK